MTRRLLPTVALVAAVAAIAVTATWAMTGNDHRVTANGVATAMMGNGNGASMMGYALQGNTKVRRLADAKRQAQRFADQFDLRVGEVIQFSKNYYASLLDRDGDGATEVLVYRNGAVRIEFGPAMMWNTEYSPMAGTYGGMMGGSGYGGGMMGGALDGSLGTTATSPSVSAADAVAIANRWLDANRPGLRVEDADAFPGYYTLETLRNGKVAGMLSVNAYTGAVWYHWWHGSFVAMTE